MCAWKACIVDKQGEPDYRMQVPLKSGDGEGEEGFLALRTTAEDDLRATPAIVFVFTSATATRKTEDSWISRPGS